MAKKDEPHKNAKAYANEYQKIRNMVDETLVSHNEAYSHAFRLMEKDGKTLKDLQYDLGLAEKFANNMADFYTKAVAKRLGIKNMDSIDEDLLLQKYAGLTRYQMVTQLKKTRHKYSAQVHDQIKNEHAQNLEMELSSYFDSRIKDTHIDEIVKYVGLDKSIDSGKLEAKKAGQMLRKYHKDGTVAADDYMDDIAYKEAA